MVEQSSINVMDEFDKLKKYLDVEEKIIIGKPSERVLVKRKSKP